MPWKPSLDELGRDLLVTRPWRRRWALARPGLGLAAYAGAARAGIWPVALLAALATFVASLAVAHDLVHGTLGVGRRATDWALFLTGSTLLLSAHAYRVTHRRHHRAFPGPDDPEGAPALSTPLGVLVRAPLYLPRLWVWAFRRGGQRGWLVAEALVPAAALAAGICVSRPLLVYALLGLALGWLNPLVSVYLPHHHPGEEPVHQTRALRGRLLPRLLLQLPYHLEHHLYPQVPGHHLGELARRLEPFLAAHGVDPVRVP
jgi:beta-carotene hydroxylase